MDYTGFFQDSMEALKAKNLYRTFIPLDRCVEHFPSSKWADEGKMRKVTIWCGNDYLGMGQHPAVLASIEECLKRSGAGAGGTRNISGTSIDLVTLEQELADLHEKESALVFTSGYVANETALETLGAKLPGCIFFSDEKNHASIIQGMRHSKANKIIFKHNNPKDLRKHLEKADRSRPKIIVFESVYSMEGNIAPLAEFCDLAKEFNTLTYLDEVHGVGMYGYGREGGGVAQQQGLAHKIDIIQGTLGKSFGLIGGYIASSRPLIDFVRSFASGFIFTTALPPYICAGAVASIRHLKSCSKEREKQQENVRLLKKVLKKNRIPYRENESHIVPVIIGDTLLCKQLAEILLDKYGIYIQPIYYPTVPLGEARLRLTPSAVHTPEMIEELGNALKDVYSFLTKKAA